MKRFLSFALAVSIMGSLVVPAAAADVGSSVEPGVSVGALEGRSSQELSVQSVPMSSFNLDQGKELKSEAKRS